MRSLLNLEANFDEVVRAELAELGGVLSSVRA
jgi:hypothetical protein